MRRQLFLASLLALGLLTVGTSATLAARGSGSGNVLYVFNGRLMADAGNSPTIAVDVNGGNRPALRKLVGQNDSATFPLRGHARPTALRPAAT